MINILFLELASFPLMTNEKGKAESLTTIRLFLQKEKALPGMHQGNIMRDDRGK